MDLRLKKMNSSEEESFVNYRPPSDYENYRLARSFLHHISGAEKAMGK